MKSPEQNQKKSYPFEERKKQNLSKLQKLRDELSEILEKSGSKPQKTHFNDKSPGSIEADDIKITFLCCDAIEIEYGNHGQLITNVTHLKSEMNIMRQMENPLQRMVKIFHHRFHSWDEGIRLIETFVKNQESEQEIHWAIDDFLSSDLASVDRFCTAIEVSGAYALSFLGENNV